MYLITLLRWAGFLNIDSWVEGLTTLACVGTTITIINHILEYCLLFLSQEERNMRDLVGFWHEVLYMYGPLFVYERLLP